MSTPEIHSSLEITFLPPMSDFATVRPPLSHPIILPTPSTLRASVHINAKPANGVPRVEIDGVFKDGTPAANFTGYFPELEAQFLYVAELMREPYSQKMIVPFRTGRHESELREVERTIPGVEGNINFEVYLHDYGDKSAVETMNIIREARESGQVDDGGIVSASIITTYSYGEVHPVSCMPRDVVRILERRNQLAHVIELLDEDVNLLTLAGGDFPSYPSPNPDDIATRFFDDGYKNVVVLRLGEPYTAGDPAQMFYFDKGTVGL